LQAPRTIVTAKRAGVAILEKVVFIIGGLENRKGATREAAPFIY
jgi:hypothetical protein